MISNDCRKGNIIYLSLYKLEQAYKKIIINKEEQSNAIKSKQRDSSSGNRS
jgi:hypothetical protein